MDIEIINQPVRFLLHGFSSSVGDQSYGEVGCRLMDEMWQVVSEARLKTTRINHWVYFADDRMFVGVEVKDAEPATISGKLELCDCELARHARHVYIGPYHELPQKWQALKAELSARGECVSMPSLEIYGHSCEGDDDSQAETTILLGLK